MATSLTAQVSVWDGSYEEFDASNEKGLSEDNPILIENAAQPRRQALPRSELQLQHDRHQHALKRHLHDEGDTQQRKHLHREGNYKLTIYK